ncbi:MAG: hypothetical protein PHZ02_05365 [Desulfocapsaceae bacterium]|nr:hypothetical protein [Desulfocapsaceae bacterium]
MKHFILSIILAFVVGLCAVGQVFAAPQKYRQSASGVQVADGVVKSGEKRTVKTDTLKIMSVLEDRIEDPEVLAKTKDKLHTLRVEDIRLVSSLCDQISPGQRTARADIVFSLVTTLIVLS